MRKTMVALAVLTATSGAVAQERPAEEAKAVPAAQAQEAEESRETPRPAIRVLQNPYDLSSFYRSGESPLGPWAGLPNDPAYRIADFYRAHEGGYPGTAHGWSAFWTNGYRAPAARALPAVSPHDRRERRPLPGRAVPGAGRADQRRFLRLLRPAASRTERPVSRLNRSAMPSRPPTVSSLSTRSTRFMG